jgi:hypothetical protein
LLGGQRFALVAEERLVVCVDGFRLSLNCGDQFYQPVSDCRMFASEGVNQITEGLAPLHHPLFKSGDLLMFSRELGIA